MASIKSRDDKPATDTSTKPKLDLTPNSEWRNRHMEWNAAFAAEHPDKAEAILKLQDTVYGLAVRGANLSEIAKILGIEEKVLKPFCAPLIDAAKAELSAILKASQIEAALGPKAHPISRIWAGKQFAGQRDDGGGEAQDAGTQQSSMFEGLSVVKTHRDEQGRTTQAPTITILVKKD